MYKRGGKKFGFLFLLWLLAKKKDAYVTFNLKYYVNKKEFYHKTPLKYFQDSFFYLQQHSNEKNWHTKFIRRSSFLIISQWQFLIVSAVFAVIVERRGGGKKWDSKIHYFGHFIFLFFQCFYSWKKSSL